VTRALNGAILLEKGGFNDFQFYSNALPQMLGYPGAMVLSNNNRNAAYRGPGKLINPEWIEKRLIRDWKAKCDLQHGKKCQLAHITPNLNRYRPNLLIDTWRMCLTKSSSTEDYITLSYVWGQAPTLKSVQGNLEFFQQPGTLGREEIFSKIPRTIRDAIALTELLHERYLWVDSLCIIQDDETNSHDQITKMASIYANSVLTIVAADGEDANYGLRGIRMASLPRNRPQQTSKLPNGAQIVEPNYSTPEGSTWSRRGWTFQESLFSRRKLIFCCDSVRWECSEATSYEDVTLKYQGYIHDRGRLDAIFRMQISKLFTKTWPDISGYSQLVCDFNHRDLTYPEDVLDAFSGITTPLSTVFQGGFLYGIPEMFFDVALLWEAQSLLKRRVPQLSVGPNSSLPSWSWMGWHGAVNLRGWNSGADYIFDANIASLRTVSLVQWYAHNKDKISTRDINCSWSNYRDSCIASSRTKIPSGWARYRYDPQLHDMEGDPGFPEYKIPKYVFKHESDEKSKFWYPIPISQTMAIPEAEIRLPFISCRTRRCWLSVGESFSRNTFCVSLRDSTGTWAGVLKLHNSEDPGSYMRRKSSRKAAQCELIAISQGYANNRGRIPESKPLYMPEYNHEERPKSSERYEYYNVLWIEWEDGIAYRKGLGRVEKNMWEKQPLEWIDVTLG
jgi:hypothetical protein